MRKKVILFISSTVQIHVLPLMWKWFYDVLKWRTVQKVGLARMRCICDIYGIRIVVRPLFPRNLLKRLTFQLLYCRTNGK